MITQCTLQNFFPLWEKTVILLDAMNCKKINVAEKFAYKQGKNEHELRFACYAIYSKEQHIAECRIVSIRSPKTDIINTMIFPKHPNLMPVYAAELLTFAGKRRVVFIDIQTPGMETLYKKQVQQKCTELLQLYLPLVNVQQAPNWATCYGSGASIFTRFNDEELVNVVSNAYLDYLNTWIKISENKDMKFNKKSYAQKSLEEYKKHHVENSPGPKFLAGIFGSEWSDEFLRKNLYK